MYDNDHDIPPRNIVHDNDHNVDSQSFYPDQTVSQQQYSHHSSLIQHPHSTAFTENDHMRYGGNGTDYDSDSDDNNDEEEQHRQRINHEDDDRKYGDSHGDRGVGVGDLSANSRDRDSVQDNNTLWGDPSDALMNNVRKFRQRLTMTSSSSSSLGMQLSLLSSPFPSFLLRLFSSFSSPSSSFFSSSTRVEML